MQKYGKDSYSKFMIPSLHSFLLLMFNNINNNNNKEKEKRKKWNLRQLGYIPELPYF